MRVADEETGPGAGSGVGGVRLTVVLVRHAKARKRSRWDGADRRRPITRSGHEQARRLAEALEAGGVERILSSPYLRCRQTLEPLAAASGLPLELEERLAEGEPAAKLLELLEELDGRRTVICSHGDVISPLLCELEERGLTLEGELRCDKGSMWIVDVAGGTARYVAPTEGLARPLLAGSSASGELDGEEEEETRIAVLDLGSTSFHLQVVEATADGVLRPILRERIMLRLGAALADRSRFPKDLAERATDAARHLRRSAVRVGAERLYPVATAAVRDARNGEKVAEQIARAIDAPVRILSGEQEARLMFAAFARRVAFGPGLALGLDLGGGSLELAVGDARGVRWETTLPLGVARLHGELVDRDPMPKKVARAIRRRVREALVPHRAEIERRAPAVCVATGGTMGALARRIIARRGLLPARSVGELFVPAAEFAELADELVRSSHEERLASPGIPRRRADLLPTGALVLSTLATELGLDGFTVSDWGLREGVILESLGLTPAASSA